MKNRLLRLFVLLFGVFLVVNLVRSSISVSQKSQIIGDTEEQLLKVKEQNNNLKRDLAHVESQGYVEKEARNKLNLGKDGEYVVIMPSIPPEVTPIPAQHVSNWEAWIQVFWQ